MIKQIDKIKKIGGSLLIKINPKVVETLNLSQGDIVEFAIIKKVVEEPQINEYECLICNYNFSADINTDDLYCPCCGQENPELIKLVMRELD